MTMHFVNRGYEIYEGDRLCLIIIATRIEAEETIKYLSKMFNDNNGFHIGTSVPIYQYLPDYS